MNEQIQMLSKAAKLLSPADAVVITFIKEWLTTELKTLREYAPYQLSFVAKNAGREQLLLSLIERLAAI